MQENKTNANVTIGAQATLQLIHDLNALIKIINVDPNFDQDLDFILNQLADPKTNRPIKNDLNLHRHRAFNPRTGEWYYRPNEDTARGASKDTEFTKKTQVTLLSRDGVIEFSAQKNGNAIGLIFDWRLCHQKDEKYIFPKEPADAQFWVKKQGITEAAHNLMRSIPLDELRSTLDNIRHNGETPPSSALFVGLSKKSLSGVFAINNEMIDRLKALYAKLKIKKLLGIDVPIFIINPKHGIITYTEKAQYEDILFASRYDYFELPRKFVDFIQTEIRKNFKLENTKLDSDFDPIIAKAGFEIFDAAPTAQLRELILSFLSFDELLTIEHPSESQEVKSKFSNLAKHIAKEKRSDDLYHLLHILKQANLVKDFFWKDHDKNDYKSYQNIITKNRMILEECINVFISDERKQEFFQARFPLIKRLIAHLTQAGSNLCVTLFKHALKTGDVTTLELLVALGMDLFTYQADRDYNHNYILSDVISNVNIEAVYTNIDNTQDYTNFKNTTKLYKEAYRDEYDDCPRKVLIGELRICPLLIATLSQEPKIVSYLAKKFPAELMDTLENFKKLKKLSLTQSRYIIPLERYWKAIGSDTAHALLLLQLTAEHHDKYIMSDSEKRLLERYLLDKVEKLQTHEAVVEFWNTHKDAFYLNQRRWPHVDSLKHKFGGLFHKNAESEPSIKTNLLKAVQRKWDELVPELELNSHRQLNTARLS